jgi:hypothetical protein
MESYRVDFSRHYSRFDRPASATSCYLFLLRGGTKWGTVELSVLEGYWGGDKPASAATFFLFLLRINEIAGSSKDRDRAGLQGIYGCGKRSIKRSGPCKAEREGTGNSADSAESIQQLQKVSTISILYCSESQSHSTASRYVPHYTFDADLSFAN